MWQDTTPDMQADYLERLNALGLSGRARLLERLCRDAMQLGLAGMRMRHPEASEEELRIRLACLRYGRQAASLLGPVPADAAEPLP